MRSIADLSDHPETPFFSDRNTLPIVGSGASAGGVSALEQFIDNRPTDTGMAFVVSRHLSSDFKNLTDNLLARHTTMPIHRVTTGIELAGAPSIW